MKNQEFVKYLIAELDKIPQEWNLIPVDGNKSPEQWKGWTKGFDRDFIKKEIKSGRAKGFGILTGKISGGILAIDCDGEAAHKLAEEMGGIPHTVSWTSGQPGRAQYLLQIPQEFWGSIATKKIKTGEINNGKDVLLELRWDGCQSVFRGEHPDTGLYKSINDLSTPIAGCPIHFIEKMLVTPENKKNPDQLTLNFNNNSIIPLYNFLSKNDRQLIDSGVSEGSRNDLGAKLARNLIGTAQRLNYLSIEFEGNPEDLFNEYSDKCSPSLPEKDRQTIWKSALKDNPTSTLTDDYLENIYKSFYRQQQKQTSKNNTPKTSGTVALKPEIQSNVVPFQRQEPPKLPPIKEALKALLERNLSSADLENEFLELSGIYPRYSKNAIESLYRKLSEEIEKQSDKNNQKNHLDKLLRLSQKSLDLSDYLHPNLSIPLKNIAQWMGTSQEAILTTLLPVAASLIHLDTRLELIKALNFSAKPIMYSGIVAESGSLKSPTQKLITNPLMSLQEIADKDYDLLMQYYQEDFEEYKASLKDKNNPPLQVPTPPKRREYFVVDVTSEAVASVQADQADRGFLGFQDELKALINSQNAYRGGRGSDAEKLLSGRDGSGIKVNRAGGKRLFCKRSGYSITGGIQPDVLRNLMGNFDDPNGFWARFIWCILPVTPSRYPENAVAYDVDNLLLDIYKKLESTAPQIHKMSPEATEIYKAWYNQLDDLKLKEIRQGLRAVYSKMKGVTGEFALILHRINAAVDGCQPDEYISKDVMAKAIKLAKFYITQIKLIHADGEAEQGEIAPQLKKLYEFALTQNTWLSASEIKKGCRLFKKSKTEDIRQAFLDLVEFGYGSVEGEGKSLKYCADIQKLTVDAQKLTKVDRVSISPIVPQTLDSTGLQEITQNSKVDKVDKKLTLCQPTQTIDSIGLQPLEDAKVDKLTSNTTDQTNPSTQLDEKPEIDTDILEPRQLCQQMPSNPDIIAVDTPSTSVNFSSTLSTFGERSPEPSPTPTPEPERLNFDHIKEGDILFDVHGQPHKITGRTRQLWETHRKQYISRNDIQQGKFHRATVEDVTKLIERTIKAKNKAQAQWLCNVYGDSSDSLMAKSLSANDTLIEIYDFDYWE